MCECLCVFVCVHTGPLMCMCVVRAELKAHWLCGSKCYILRPGTAGLPAAQARGPIHLLQNALPPTRDKNTPPPHTHSHVPLHLSIDPLPSMPIIKLINIPEIPRSLIYPQWSAEKSKQGISLAMALIWEFTGKFRFLFCTVQCYICDFVGHICNFDHHLYHRDVVTKSTSH